MAITTHAQEHILEVNVKGALSSDDFKELAAIADNLVKEHGKIRLLLNATDFQGWENFSAAENHFRFVKHHHQNVEKIALIAGHMWQHWVAAMASIFVHPEVKVFHTDKGEEAERWVRQ